MRNLNITRIIAVLAFLGLAGFSCYWTAESLYTWLPAITIYGAWMLAVVFFIVASICFGKLLQSLDRQSDFYGKLFGRTGALLLSIVGLLAFWLFFSMPTNTHTLLYQASVVEVATNDLIRTQGYLNALRHNNVEVKKIDQKYKDKANAVDALLTRMLAEIDNPSAVGIGVRFNTVLAELDKALSADNNHPVSLQRVTNVGSSRVQWLTALNYYKEQAYSQLRLYRASCDREIAEVKRQMNSPELAGLITNNERSLHDLAQMKGVDNGIMEVVCKDLTKSYSYIGKNAQFLTFKGGDKALYTRDGAIPETKAMQSVPDVWRDYITTSKYDGHGFLWWILAAVLVDIAGFIFFNMAFNSKQNNAIA